MRIPTRDLNDVTLVSEDTDKGKDDEEYEEWVVIEDVNGVNHTFLDKV